MIELRRYIDKLEEEREVESKNHEAEKAEQNQMLALAKENLDRDREEQDVEKWNLKEGVRLLAEEKAKVEDERKFLESEKREIEEKSKSCKVEIKSSLEYLTQEKEKTDLEMKLNEVERKSLEEKTKLCVRIGQLQKALTAATIAREKEESHQLSVRRQEKEFKEGMLDNLNSKDRKIEDLESEVSKLEKRLEEERASTSKFSTSSLEVTAAGAGLELSPSKHDEAEPGTSTISKVQCVLCSKKNLFPVSAFVFHIAREHMFDQYRVAGMPSEGEQVARFLSQLEEKAKKEVEVKVHHLEKSLMEAGEQLARKEAGEVKDEGVANYLQNRVQKELKELEKKVKQQNNKIMSLEGEKLALISRKESLEKQISREGTVRGELEMVTWKNDTLGKEVEDVRKQNDELAKEVSRKRKDLKDETQKRRGWRDKYEAKKNEAETLKMKCRDLSIDLERLSEALVRERQEKKVEVAAMMQRVRNLEAAEDELLEMATKFGLAEVEDEIYNDGAALESVTGEKNVAPTDKASVDGEACSDLPNFGRSEVEKFETEELVSTDKDGSSVEPAAKRRCLNESICSVGSEVKESFGEHLENTFYQDAATHAKEEDNFDFSLLDSSQEDASADIQQ